MSEITRILDKLVTDSHNSVAKGDSLDFTLRLIAEAEQELKAYFLSLVGDDEPLEFARPGESELTVADRLGRAEGRNNLRAEIRRRAGLK